MPTFKINALGRQGDGIADGPVFVARALPGEIVEGDPVDGRIATPKIVEPSGDRVKPPCRHFKTCGGCLMQHASDPLLATWKQDIVREALQAEGLDIPMRDIAVSPAKSRRRAKYAARRTKSGAMAGFHTRGSDALVDIQVCPLVDRGLDGAPALARAIAIQGTSRKAEITVHCTATPNGMDVAVEGGRPMDKDLTWHLPQIAIAHNVVRLFWNGELVAQSATATHPIGKAHVTLPPNAFLQATEHGEKILQACVAEAIEGSKHVLDLFSGCGTFALHIAETAPVTAIEGDKGMAKASQEAANHAGLTHPVKALSRDLFRDPLIASELIKFDAVVLDPPRAGASAQIAELAKSSVSKIAYVSCDPATFARDAKVLVNAGYVPQWVQVVDQFRWSAHVELAAQFIRADK